MKLYKGKHPGEDGEFHAWKQIGLLEQEGVDWVIYERCQLNTQEWLDIRVVAKDGAPRKASYWMQWSLDKERFGRSRDAGVMVDNRRGLYDAVREYLVTYNRAGDLV
jgi:hypothetical protein